MHARTKAVAAIGALALAGTVMLGGCGGSSTTAPAAAASTAPSAEASETVAAFDPPRPAGIPDQDWTEIVVSLDPSGVQARFEARTLEENTQRCEKPYAPLTADEIAANAAQAVDTAAGSTIEEWTALLEYVNDAHEAYGVGPIIDALCATLPASEASPEAAE